MDKILAARVLFVICTHVTILHLCYMKNALVFSQSDHTLYVSFLYIVSTDSNQSDFELEVAIMFLM